MKQYFKYITTMVALLAMTVGTWADDERVNITILPEALAAAPGTVTSAIEGNTCTLTVTPTKDAGYYATVENISVELTVSGNVAQSPRHAPNINNKVEVTALTPFDDPCGVTRYSFTFPDETYNAEVTVEFQPIAITVGGVAVSPLNYANITGANITGTVSFTPAIPASENIPAKPAKLTLNGATIDMTETNGYPIVSSLENLTVVLIGENTLKVNADKANGFHYSNAANSGTLTFAHTEFPGVNGFGKLTVTGGTIASGYTIGNDFPESQTVTGWRKSESTNSTLTYVEYYNLHVGDTQINSDQLSILDGKVSYYPVTQTLSLNNFTTTDNIQTSLSNLTVALTGVNTVGTVSFSNGQLAVAGTLTICKATNSQADLNKLTATSVTGFSSVTVVDPMHANEDQNIFSDAVDYSLWVNGTQVTSENKDNITDRVSFNATENTLTLNGINATLEEGAFITNGLDQLTINLLGTNTIACGNFNFLVKKDGDVDHEVAFTTDPRAAGNLTMTINKDVEWYTGHSTAYQNSLTAKTEESGDILTVTIAAPSEFYGLTIGGTEVTNMNAGNVQAGVSFDPTNNTLTLNTATITGNIEINRPELNVYLIGSNTMSGGFTLAEGCASSKLTFASPSGANDKLTMGAAFAAGITDEYSNHLQLDGTTIQLPNTYGITVAGIDITPTNRENVLNDGGKVVFDGNAKLILTDATINGKIKVESEAQLPDGLTIELVGHNRISNDNGVAIDNGLDRNLKVKFITVSNKSVSLVYYYTTAAPTLASAFENCDVSFADVLTSSENADAHTLTVGLKLELIVTETNPVADSNFREVMNSTTNTNNTVIDGWQYTMGDESAAPAEVGGFDQSTGKMTFTEKSVMDEIPQNSDDITGISTMIGAGEHILELKGVDIEPDYDMVVKVAEQAKPISVREEMEKKAKLVLPEVENRNISITLVTPKPGRIRICMIKRPTPSLAPAMKAGHRIGPKASVTGALGGLKVTNNNMQSPEPPATTYKSMEVSAVAAGIGAIGNALNGYTCGDPDITDLPDNMFVDNTPSSAPRRAGEVKTILPEGLTFVDFSGTKITGMEVDRTTGAFNGVPDNVFIYMPAGNSVAAGTKNVVIGGISDNVELDGGIDAKPFKAMKDFKAAQVTLKRTFEAGGDDKKATIYLPYDIPQEDAYLLGTFYEYKSNDGTTVDMKSVTTGGLKANKPYIFQAKEGGVTDPMVRVVDVKTNPADTEGFKGVFERKDYEPGMYCYAGENRGGVTIGQFVEMGPGSYVPPFRAYMIGNGAPSYAIAWDGIVDEFDDTTAIETIETKKTVASEKTSEGWWTLNGIRMTDQPKKAGLYIFNGKMVVVK